MSRCNSNNIKVIYFHRNISHIFIKLSNNNIIYMIEIIIRYNLSNNFSQGCSLFIRKYYKTNTVRYKI
jgi:hypothetical protein